MWGTADLLGRLDVREDGARRAQRVLWDRSVVRCDRGGGEGRNRNACHPPISQGRGGFGQERLAGVAPCKLGLERRRVCDRRGDELAGRQVEKREPAAPVVPGREHGSKVVVGARVEHGLVHGRTRRDDADDLATHETLRRLRVLHLLADGDLVPLPQELRDVCFAAANRHSGHGVSVSRREDDVQFAGHRLRVLEERLVEIP